MIAAGLGMKAGGAVGRDAVAEPAVGAAKLTSLAGFLRKLAVCPDTIDQYAHCGPFTVHKLRCKLLARLLLAEHSRRHRLQRRPQFLQAEGGRSDNRAARKSR